MTTVRSRLRSVRLPAYSVDRHAALMAALFVVVQAGAVWLADVSTRAGAEASPPGGVEGSAAGAAWVGVEVAFAAFMLVLLAVYARAPAWVQTIIRRNALAAALLWLGWQVGQTGAFYPLVGVGLVGIAALMALDYFGLYWIVNNVLGVLLAVYGGAAIGIMFGVEALLVALVGFTIYDYYFADRRPWMFSLGQFMLRIRMPMVVFVPTGWRLDWDEIVESLVPDADDADGDGDGDDPDDLFSWGIGMADLMLPAGVAAALAVSDAPGVFAGSTLAIAGVVAGTVLACFRLRHKMLTKGSGAGLPPLATGVIGGWLVASMAVAVVATLATIGTA